MCTFTVFSLLLCGNVFSASIDQRQTGELNVQIDLKNLNIFALSKGKEEYVDYDYAYDYSEMTIKPQNGTTSTTIKPLNYTTETVVQTENDNATSQLESTTKSIDSSSTTEKIINNTSSTNQPMLADDITAAAAVTVTTIAQDASVTLTSSENHNSTISDCKKGFFRNTQGNCEFKLQNPSNVLLKMLQQKSKAVAGGNRVRKT